MENPDKKKWCKLSFVYKQDYVLLKYEDGYDNKVTDAGKQYRTFNGGRLGSVHIAAEIDMYIMRAFTAMPRERATTEGNKVIPLAIYIDHILPNTLKRLVLWDYIFSNEDFKSMFEGLFIPGDCMVVNYLPEGKLKSFEMPFRIRFAGKDASKMMSILKDAWWYNSHDKVEGNGLDLAMLEDSIMGLEKGVDLLIVDALALLDWLSKYTIPSNSLPRVLIVTDDYYNRILARHPEIFRKNIAVILLYSYPETDFTAFVKDILYSIIHDFPLHEALEFAGKRAQNIGASFFASRTSNHSLRISDALVSFKEKVNQYERVVNYGNVDSFLKKFDTEPSTGFSNNIQNMYRGSGAQGATAWPAYFHQINTLGDNFNKETTGLVPLSFEIARFNEQYLPQFKKARKEFLSIVNNKDNYTAIREQQERKVDVTIDALNDSMIFVPANKNVPLNTNAIYRLNVSIGLTSSDSLMAGEITPIDLLLPDPTNARGHELDFVVFRKDFTLLTPAIKKVTLPLLGASETARFTIQTPKEPMPAQLRIGIFYKNNLLQAFLLEAEVRHDAMINENPVIKVKMDLATTSKFTNFAELRPRDVFIGVNDDAPGSHTLFIKKGNLVGQVRGLNSQLIEDAQAEFGQLLHHAYFDKNGNTRFNSYAKPGDALSDDFFEQVREFARFGEKVNSQLFRTADTAMRTELIKIMQHSNLVIQIGRYDPNYSFPWAMLYDYAAPPDITGINNYPVCMGIPFKPGEHDAFKQSPGFGCPHNPDTKTFCIEGFWGMRHLLEQIFKNEEPADFVTSISRNPDSSVFFSYNSEDKDATRLAALLQRLHPALKVIEPETNLMDLLWDNAQRPVMLIIVGHLETGLIDGEPNEPRIISFPEEKWKGVKPIPEDKFIRQSLLARFSKAKNKWQGNPQSIVLLVNCSVAKMDVRSLNSIVSGFSMAGAGAIVGTECDITSGLGARFVEEIMDAIYTRKREVGMAIQEFNRNLVKSGNPLAFVFTCYGNINLSIQ